MSYHGLRLVDDRDAGSESPICPVVVLTSEAQGDVLVEVADQIENCSRERHVGGEEVVTIEPRTAMLDAVSPQVHRGDNPVTRRLDSSGEDDFATLGEVLGQGLKPRGRDDAVVVRHRNILRPHLLEAAVRGVGYSGLR
jgi:hypothetical protein